MENIIIIDYGVGNLRSVQKAFELVGANPVIASEPNSIDSASAIVLPGVGAFGDAMDKLKERDLINPLREAALQKKIPLLGICLGMQLLFEHSEEGGSISGLNILPGKVVRFELEGKKDYLGAPLRLPHIGWNSVTVKTNSRLLANVSSGSDFYFVHSYHISNADKKHMAAKSHYGADFICAVEFENVMATQFHPEKSQREGQRVIANFAAICSNGNR